MVERPNISQLDITAIEALRRGQVEIASELIGEHVRKIQGPLPGRKLEIPIIRKPEVEKKHDKRDGKR